MKYDELGEDIKIEIIKYLDYETINELSYTNHKNNEFNKKIKEYIKPLSMVYPYVEKDCKKYNYTNYYIYSPLYVKVVEYNDSVVSYEYVTYGKYNIIPFSIMNVYIPIMENRYSILYYIMPEIIKPSYRGRIVKEKEDFLKKYKIYKNKFYENIKERNIQYCGLVLFMFIKLNITYMFFYIPFFVSLYTLYFFVYLYRFILFPLFFLLSLVIILFIILLYFQIANNLDYYFTEYYP